MTEKTWDQWNDTLGSTDVFVTRYYHYLRWLATLRHIETILSMNGNIRTALDIGCNKGQYSAALGERNIITDGIDPQIGECILIRQKNVTYSPSDFFDWNPGRKYDLILSLEILEHVAHRHRFMKRIGTLLNDGGILLLSGPNGRSPLYKAWYLKDQITGVKETNWHYLMSVDYYNDLLFWHGFETTAWETNGILPVWFNGIEKVLSCRAIERMARLDMRVSEMTRGFGANYISISRKGKGGELHEGR